MDCVHQIFTPSASAKEPPSVQAIIDHLGLQIHPEGGYYAETDRDELTIPSPFPVSEIWPKATRSASTTIYYLLTPKSPQGHFHRNAGRTVHTLHWGRARYVIIHADEKGSPSKRVETYTVGRDVLKGEKVQWIVDGGKYKASFLVPDADDSEDSTLGCLISETVVPGFEFDDHDFLKLEAFKTLVVQSKAEGLDWLVRRD